MRQTGRLNLGWVLEQDGIELDDVTRGEEAYSAELLVNIGFEIRDVMPEAVDVLYEFVEEPRVVTEDRVRDLLSPKVGANTDRLTELLLWFGFLGLERSGSEATYIYDVKYDFKRLLALLSKQEGMVRYSINPAFWSALQVRRGDRNQLSFPNTD